MATLWPLAGGSGMAEPSSQFPQCSSGAFQSELESPAAIPSKRRTHPSQTIQFYTHLNCADVSVDSVMDSLKPDHWSSRSGWLTHCSSAELGAGSEGDTRCFGTSDGSLRREFKTGLTEGRNTDLRGFVSAWRAGRSSGRS